jgi:hypothetical protein
MADIFDSDDLNNNELTEFEDKPEVKQEPEEELPEKFKGKPVKEIVKSYEELEKQFGRQAQEVGELRKLTDQILKNQLEQAKSVPQAQEVDFFDDPKEAVNNVVNNHPAVVEARKTAALLKAEKVKKDLTEQFGDPEEYGKDPEFIAWVKASKVRMQLAAAAENYDYDAAAELLSTYKELKGVKAAKNQEQASEIQEKQKRSLKAGSVDMSSGTGESSRKVYRRADLIRLMRTDPKRYEALQDEIMAAYSEGRVK